MRISYKTQPNKPDFKFLAKTKLIKKLKEDNNFRYEFIKGLDEYSDYVYDFGDYQDIQRLSERGEEGACKRLDKILTAIKELFPEPAIERAIKEELEYIYCLRGDISREVPSEDRQAIKSLLHVLLKDATLEELYDFTFSKLDYKITAEEYISISVHSSTWSYYISGSIELGGKTFKAKGVSYRASESTRL